MRVEPAELLSSDASQWHSNLESLDFHSILPSLTRPATLSDRECHCASRIRRDGTVSLAKVWHESPSFFQISIDCHTKNGSEYFFDTERITVIYHRSQKLPLSKFSMIVTPMKLKTRQFRARRERKNQSVFLLGMYSQCGFDCFSDTYCIHSSLVCDRYRNCPNQVDEAQCEYSRSCETIGERSTREISALGHHHEPLSVRSKIILFFVLLTIISMAISSILICYLCCGIAHSHRLHLLNKDRKPSQ